MLPGKVRHHDSARHLALNLEMTQKERGEWTEERPPCIVRKIQGAMKPGVTDELLRPSMECADPAHLNLQHF